MNKQLYFSSNEETMCYDLEYHLHDARLDGLKEIKLIEAIPDNETKDYVWCTEFGEVTERSLCKKSQCEMYKSKSGRGVCEHRGKLYQHGEEVIIKL